MSFPAFSNVIFENLKKTYRGAADFAARVVVYPFDKCVPTG